MIMLTPFMTAMTFLLKWEGGFVDNPADLGGPTKYGISQKRFPGLDIANLTLEDAYQLYRRHYWRWIKGDELPLGVAIVLFDYAATSGVSRASRALQRVVGAEVDGHIGPRTITALRAACRGKLGAGERRVILGLLNERTDYLSALAAKSPRHSQFLKGWLRRVNDLSMTVGVAYGAQLQRRR